MAGNEGLYNACVNAIFVMALATVAPARWIKAPYGRHARSGWGPALPPALAWSAMESPSLIVPLFLLLFRFGRNVCSNPPLAAAAVMAPFVVHYLQRSVMYPLRLPPSANRVPAGVAALAFIFNVYNSYLQARWVTHYGSYTVDWLHDPRFIFGILVFFTGMFINIWADSILLSLRKDLRASRVEKVQRYKIPSGGLFEYISCANYFGEIVEWFGWSILTWSKAGLGFFIYTVANLGPRAAAHHEWYHKQFADTYPKSRKALIPFLF